MNVCDAVKGSKFLIAVFCLMVFAMADAASAADTTPPSISITCPPTGQTYNSATISVSGTASDNTGVGKVEVRVGSGAWKTATGTVSWSISGLALASGANTVYAKATDTSGNTKEASITVTYDSTAKTTGGLPFKRAMYVNDWGTTYNTAASIDNVINTAKYMNVDTLYIGTRSGYWEAARYPATKGSWNAWAGNNYDGMPLLEYAIQKAHAKGIRIEAWYTVNVIYSKRDSEYKLFGTKYNDVNSTGGLYHSVPEMRLDIANHGLREYHTELAGWIAGHYPTLDGIHIEEPMLHDFSYSSAVRTDVLAKFGYDPVSSPGTRSLATIKGDINSVQRDNWYTLFSDMRSAINTKKTNPNLLFSFNEPNMLYLNPSVYPHAIDPAYISNNNLVDYYLYQNAVQDTSNYISKIKTVDAAVQVPIVIAAYIVDGNFVINENLYNEISITCSSGSDAEAIFTWNRIDKSINGIVIKEWLHNNPPSASCIGGPSASTPPSCTAPTTNPDTQPSTTQLTLKPGWNQISSPVAAGIGLAAIESSCTILPYKNQKLWAWNATAQVWMNPAKVESFKGYWIYTAYQCTVPLSGTAATFSTLQLYNGWNKISASGTLSAISGTCSGHITGNWIWNWDKATEKWIHPTTMELGKGYWIKVDQNCVLGA